MPKITYVQASGEAETIEITSGLSLMEGAVRNGILGIDGDCGGACACGTCRVQIPAEWLSKTGSASEFENDLLSAFADNASDMRLSCQMTVSPELEGIRVVVAPGEV